LLTAGWLGLGGNGSGQNRDTAFSTRDRSTAETSN
jgi:hypothetical protein